MNITLADLRAANLARQDEWCPDQKPDLSFRGNELAGEIGEAIEAAVPLFILSALAGRASNLIKKLERERYGWIGSRVTKADLAEELGDIVICCDLVGITAGISLQDAVVGKFNATSEKNGLSVKLVPQREEANTATHRHMKRGTEYTLIGIGKMQAENWEEREYSGADEPVAGSSVDMREVAIYRSCSDGTLWVRPREEFEDGRFEAISSALAATKE